MKPGPAVIKKYGNRRLYDTAASRYVNLEDIAALIRAGKDVQVVDAQSGADLTRVILTQIITEDARDKSAGLPLELLRQLIVATDHAGREFIMWYLKSAFEAYEKVQATMRSGLTEMQSAVVSPLQTMRRVLGMTSEQPASPSELDMLRQRIAELEQRLQPTDQRRATRRRRSLAKR